MCQLWMIMSIIYIFFLFPFFLFFPRLPFFFTVTDIGSRRLVLIAQCFVTGSGITGWFCFSLGLVGFFVVFSVIPGLSPTFTVRDFYCRCLFMVYECFVRDICQLWVILLLVRYFPFFLSFLSSFDFLRYCQRFWLPVSLYAFWVLRLISVRFGSFC